MYGTLLALASSQCCWSPRTHTCILGRGICFNLITKPVYQYSLLLPCKISGRIISETNISRHSKICQEHTIFPHWKIL
jgi:hypothetical protein